jgi:hypothetical protein
MRTIEAVQTPSGDAKTQIHQMRQEKQQQQEKGWTQIEPNLTTAALEPKEWGTIPRSTPERRTSFSL